MNKIGSKLMCKINFMTIKKNGTRSIEATCTKRSEVSVIINC
ncbi:hypothetical protein [Cellulosilyticum sp. I15G10I2]|nr:hypothetical protein [Cellulosilyticum sp. I15G10I2]